MLKRFALCLIAIAAVSTNVQAETCAQLEQKVAIIFTKLPLVADQWGLIDELQDTGTRGTKQCPQSATLRYAALRGTELNSWAADRGASDVTLVQLAVDSVSYADASARLLTVISRVEGNGDLARKAVNLDPSYGPAKRALALALARSGQGREALKLLPLIRPTKEDLITTARVMLLAGDAPHAVESAKKAVNSAHPDLSETTPGSILERNAYEVLGIAFNKSGHTLEAKKAFRIAAAAGSHVAADALAKMH